MHSRPLLGIVPLLAGVTVAGCTHARPTFLPDGNRGFSLSCGSVFNSWLGCLSKAGKRCGATGYTVTYSNEVDREMLIECNRHLSSNAIGQQTE